MEPILDRLFLSDLSEANDPLFLKVHDIQAILHFGEGGMFSEDIKLYHRTAPANGSLSRDLLRDGIDFLHESLRMGRRVLAVGSAGATIIAAYLSEVGFNSDHALRMVLAHHRLHPDLFSLELHEAELQRRAILTLHSAAAC